MKPLLSIQYLRAFAALAVAAYHACQWISSPIAIGAAGVDVFFIISGFIMWTSVLGRPIGAGEFLWRRFVRVVPLYWLATLALAAGALAAPGVFPHVEPRWDHVLLSMLFIPHVNPEGSAFPLLAPGWTLNYEAVFYLIFAVGLLLAPQRRMAWLAGALSPLAALGLIYFPAYRYFANPMLLQFLAGAVIGRMWASRHLPAPGWGLAVAALAVALYVAAALAHTLPDDFARPLVWGAPALLLVAGLVCAEPRLPNLPLLRRLGDASYAIYLAHHPLMALLNKAMGPTDPRLFFALAMALSVAAGLAIHAFIERPLLSLLRGGPRALDGEPRLSMP